MTDGVSRRAYCFYLGTRIQRETDRIGRSAARARGPALEKPISPALRSDVRTDLLILPQLVDKAAESCDISPDVRVAVNLLERALESPTTTGQDLTNRVEEFRNSVKGRVDFSAPAPAQFQAEPSAAAVIAAMSYPGLDLAILRTKALADRYDRMARVFAEASTHETRYWDNARAEVGNNLADALEEIVRGLDPATRQLVGSKFVGLITTERARARLPRDKWPRERETESSVDADTAADLQTALSRIEGAAGPGPPVPELQAEPSVERVIGAIARPTPPATMSEEQIDEYDWLYSGDSLDDARAAVTSRGGVLYTQLGGGGEVMYERGEHLANRTGWYVVVLPGSAPPPELSDKVA